MSDRVSSHRNQAVSAVVFPGSFDPLTLGHTDIINRARRLFGRVVVVVLDNPSKEGLFDASERVEIIKREFAVDSGVEVYAFSGLLVESLKSVGIFTVVRGLRAVSDYEYEAQMALMNRHLLSGVETLFMVAKEECSYISSTVVKQIARLGGDVSRLVPESTINALEKKLTPLKFNV